jgi:hypothetical protein
MENVYPLATHTYCAWHIAENAKKRPQARCTQVDTRNIHAIADALNESEYTRGIDALRQNNAVFEYITNIDREKWATCYVNGRRYGKTTSNAAESMNSATLNARSAPFFSMIKILLYKMAEGQHIEHQKAAKGTGLLSQYASAMIQKLLVMARRLQFVQTGETSATFTNGITDTALNLTQTDKCACGFYAEFALPCIHMIQFCISIRKEYTTDISDI